MPLFDLFWAMLWFFLFLAWIWLLVSVVTDVFRSDDLSGWAKALWTVFIIVLPLLGVLVYLISRGDDMAERANLVFQQRDAATRDYIRDAAGGPSTADELTKLAALRDRGVLSDEEFERQKAALLS